EPANGVHPELLVVARIVVERGTRRTGARRFPPETLEVPAPRGGRVRGKCHAPALANRLYGENHPLTVLIAFRWMLPQHGGAGLGAIHPVEPVEHRQL